jgi:putative ABC transport system ATP-binding protein
MEQLLISLKDSKKYTSYKDVKLLTFVEKIELRSLSFHYPNKPSKIFDKLDLEIKKGEKIGIIGRTGVGKSTLIETLGMMENTIGSDKNIVLNISLKDRVVALPQLWKNSSDEIAKFRREQFSFIFQSTNLFSHLSIYENVLMPVWIYQDSENQKEVEKVNSLFRELLPNIYNKRAEHSFNRSISSISGGQRQRLSFIRALAAPYKILFGDEPTGNLDVATAKKVINILTDEIVGTDKMACLVTHDIDLAMNHANVIIGLSEEYDKITDSSFGTVKNKNVLTRIVLYQQELC